MRRVPASADRYDHELWAKLAAQGVTGLLVEPEYGRVGLGAAELEAVAEETGAALPPAPFLSSAVLTVALVRAAGTTADKQRLLPKLADGTAIGTVAVTGPRGNWAPDGVDIRAGADGTLTGTAHYVTSGQIADVILVVAQTHDGPAVFHVAPDAPGFQRTAAAVFDPATLSTYTFTASPSQRIGTAGWEAVQQALDLAVIALVGEQAGGARRIFDLTVDHLKTRIQFGRPIVSFRRSNTWRPICRYRSNRRLRRLRTRPPDTRTLKTAAMQSHSRDSPAPRPTSTPRCRPSSCTVASGSPGNTPRTLYLRRARTGLQLFGASVVHRERFLLPKGA